MGTISIVDLIEGIFGIASIVADWVLYVGLLGIVAVEFVFVGGCFRYSGH